MAHNDEIPTDAEVIAALQSCEGGLRPSDLVSRLEEAGHTKENVVRAMQRVLDRGKASLSDGGRFVAAEAAKQAA